MKALTLSGCCLRKYFQKCSGKKFCSLSYFLWYFHLLFCTKSTKEFRRFGLVGGDVITYCWKGASQYTMYCDTRPNSEYSHMNHQFLLTFHTIHQILVDTNCLAGSIISHTLQLNLHILFLPPGLGGLILS